MAEETLGDASASRTTRPDCANLAKEAMTAFEAWLTREQARLTSKMETPRGKRSVPGHIAWVRDRTAAMATLGGAQGDGVHDNAHCSETTLGRWELHVTTFSGTIDADPPDESNPESQDGESRAGFKLFARGELRFRGTSSADGGYAGARLTMSLALEESWAMSITSVSGTSAEITRPTFLVAGNVAGEPVVLVRVDRGNVDLVDSNPRTTSQTILFSVQAGQIRASDRLPAGLEVVDMADVDGDGRSDLLTPGPFVGKLPAAIDEDNLLAVHGPLLVAHQQPDGSFALHDAVAVAHARRLCPRKPARFVLPFDPDAGAHALWSDGAQSLIVCARLWGLPSSEIRAALQSVGALESWADVKPPLELRP